MVKEIMNIVSHRVNEDEVVPILKLTSRERLRTEPSNSRPRSIICQGQAYVCKAVLEPVTLRTQAIRDGVP